jgi:hypothetical protein
MQLPKPGSSRYGPISWHEHVVSCHALNAVSLTCTDVALWPNPPPHPAPFNPPRRSGHI